MSKTPKTKRTPTCCWIAFSRKYEPRNYWD